MNNISEEQIQSGLHIRNSIQQASYETYPYPHWMITDVLPTFICNSLVEWTPDPESISGEIQGRRENNNQNRVFVNSKKRHEDKGCAALADAFEAKETRDLFLKIANVDLSNTWLRLELCLDGEGFWLEPHTDIGAKKLSFLLSLSTTKGAEAWGTDIMNPEGKSVARSSGKFNSAFLFIPAHNTWHGYEKRPMDGVRRTLIINYVDSSWRAKHELAFPS